MDLRLTFNEDPANYDRFRPTYAEQLFFDIIHFSQLDRSKSALEIGIGTGQATRPFLESGCKVTAIELGDNLARFSRHKFADYHTFEVINQDFESVQLEENAYDLVYSATAFHWIPKDSGLPKVYRLLKSGGVFAWFSIHPAPAPAHTLIHDALQVIYAEYRSFFGEHKPDPSPQMRQQQSEKICSDRMEDLNQYGFTDLVGRLYEGSRTFQAEDYTALLCSYSDHRAMPEAYRKPFLNRIAETIHRFGGSLTLADTMILVMGRKP